MAVDGAAAAASDNNNNNKNENKKEEDGKVIKVKFAEIVPSMVQQRDSFFTRAGSGAVIRTHLGLIADKTLQDLRTAEPSIAQLVDDYLAMDKKTQDALCDEYAAGLFWQAVNFVGQSYGLMGKVLTRLSDPEMKRNWTRGFFYVSLTKLGELFESLQVERPPCSVPVEEDIEFMPKVHEDLEDYAAALQCMKFAFESLTSAFVTGAAIKDAKQAADVLALFFFQYMDGFRVMVVAHGLELDIVTRTEKQVEEFASARAFLLKAYEPKYCRVCNAIGQSLKTCAGCHEVTYCSQKCQRAHWAEHKKTCAGATDKKKDDAGAGKQEDDGEVNIAGLDRLVLLHNLWQNTRSQGVLAHIPTHWDTAQAMRELSVSSWSLSDTTETDAFKLAERLADADSIHADYLCGRPIKVWLEKDKDTADPKLYDRDAGAGTFARVVKEMREEAETEKGLREEAAAAAEALLQATQEQFASFDPFKEEQSIPSKIKTVLADAAEAMGKGLPEDPPPSYDEIVPACENVACPDPGGAPRHKLEADGETLLYCERCHPAFAGKQGHVTQEEEGAPPLLPSSEDEDEEVLRFVSAVKARRIADEQTEKAREMEHYWKKAASYVSNQEQRTIPMLNAEKEFEAWEDKYFADMPAPIRITTELAMPKNARFNKWIWMTE